LAVLSKVGAHSGQFAKGKEDEPTHGANATKYGMSANGQIVYQRIG
jgi:hypothetical protein